MTDIVKTTAQWADEIKAEYGQTVESYIKLGRKLIAAKDALGHGEFEIMIEADLPFESSTAQRLMSIARHPMVSNPAHVQLMPPSWGTMYELTKLPDKAFETA